MDVIDDTRKWMQRPNKGSMDYQEVQGVKQRLEEDDYTAAQQQPTGQAGGGQVVIPQREHQTTGGGAMPTRALPSKRVVAGTVVDDTSKEDVLQQANEFADINDLESMQRYLESVYPKQTAEDREREERKQKRDQTLATIGDGLSAFHEAYSYMRGVQPMTDGTSLRGRMTLRKEIKDRERQEMDAKRDTALRNWAVAKQNGSLRKEANRLRAEELERQKKNDQARDDYRKMNLRQRELERQRKIANSPGGDVYFKTMQDMLADGYSEEEAHNEAMKELAAYNTQHGTNYTIVDKRDNSGRVSRTVTVKTNDQQTAGQVEQVANSNVDNAPAPKSKRSGKSGSSSNKKSNTKKPKAY